MEDVPQNNKNRGSTTDKRMSKCKSKPKCPPVRSSHHQNATSRVLQPGRQESEPPRWAEMTYFPKQLGTQVWYQLLLEYQRSLRDSLGTACIVEHYVTGGS